MKRGRSATANVNLFLGERFNVRRVAGALKGTAYFEVKHEVIDVVKVLIRQHNVQLLPQIVLDQYVIPCILVMTNNPILEKCNWRMCVTRLSSTFQVAHLVDIAHHVRNMLLGLTPVDQLGLLVQYSMPYIKHNRLSFPSFEQTSHKMLSDLVRLVLATCLGLFSSSTKKPVWQQRLQLFAMFFTMLSSGSAYDLYIFCTEHIALIRLSLVEYYAFFVEAFMPVELRMQHILFGAGTDITSIFRQIRLICNSFRHAQFQTTHVELNWDGILNRCQACVEKCNRTCKAKSKVIVKAYTSTVIDSQYIHMALQVRPCRDISVLGLQMPGVDSSVVQSVHNIHKMISIHYLPFNIVNQQRIAIQSQFRVNSKAVLQGLYLHMCLKCKPGTGNIDIDRNIRIGPNEQLFCGKCLQQDAMIRIHLLGRTVKIRNTTFYLCFVCLRVHAWKAIGGDFMTCATTPRLYPTSKQVCVICERNNNVSSMDVLDTAIGVIQNVSLCQRHTPYPFQMKFVCDLQSLMHAITNKYKNSIYTNKKY